MAQWHLTPASVHRRSIRRQGFETQPELTMDFASGAITIVTMAGQTYKHVHDICKGVIKAPMQVRRHVEEIDDHQADVHWMAQLHSSLEPALESRPQLRSHLGTLQSELHDARDYLREFDRSQKHIRTVPLRKRLKWALSGGERLARLRSDCQTRHRHVRDQFSLYFIPSLD
jgi:hypothetical protein